MESVRLSMLMRMDAFTIAIGKSLDDSASRANISI